MAANLGEIRVLAQGDHEDTIMDTGEKGRPPDLVGTWASKVAGSQAGGRPVPDDILAEEFVSERLTVVFPDGEDGEPVVTIGEEVLNAMNGLWKQCMIVKVLGRNITIPMLSRKLRELWKPMGAMYVMDLPRQFFLIRFEQEDEYLAALTGRPWRAFGSYLMVQAWSSGFNPLKDEIATTPVWIRLADIPVNFYHKAILMGIARGLGKPIRVDSTTLNFDRARFARICVEVNLKKPLKGTIMVNGERYYVSYEGLTSICPVCGIYGHMAHNCPKVSMEKTKVGSNPTAEGVRHDNIVTEVEEGFTMVKQARRRTDEGGNQTPLSETRARPGGGSGSRRPGARSLKSGDLVVHNRYGNLEVDMVGAGIRAELNGAEENKENESVNIANQGGKGKSRPHGKGMIFNAADAENHNGPRVGGREKRSISVKASESNGPSGSRSKHGKVVKPMRGLIFGPIIGEVAMSVSGKRLRMEKTREGRYENSVLLSSEQSNPTGDALLLSGTENMEMALVESSPTHERSLQESPSEYTAGSQLA